MKKILFTLLMAIICLSGALSQTINESEPNDSFEQANLVTAPVTIIAASGSEDDEDFFKVDLASAAVITVKLTEMQADQHFRFYAFNNNEDQIAFIQSPELGAGFTYDLLLPAGVSYFKMVDYNNKPSSTAYHLELFIHYSDGCELNNDFESACLISPNANLHPQLFGYNSDLGGKDSDYYKLDLPVGGVVTVNLSNLASSQYLRLYAYNSTENQIAFIQSPEDGTGFSIDLLLPPGVSYILLFDYSGVPSDSIHLNLDLVYDMSGGCEPNNSFETACLVEPDTVLHPQLLGYNTDLGGNDTDYYKVEAGIILNECFLISDVQPDQYIRLYVYDSEYSQIGFVQSPETGSGFYYCLDLNLDVFYFKLVDYNSSSSNEPITVTITGVSALSVPEIKQNKDLVNVYPNPAQKNFTITFPQISTRLEILNSLGQILETRLLFRQEQMEFELKKVGIYFIRIRTEKEILTKKLIISNYL